MTVRLVVNGASTAVFLPPLNPGLAGRLGTAAGNGGTVSLNSSTGSNTGLRAYLLAGVVGAVVVVSAEDRRVAVLLEESNEKSLLFSDLLSGLLLIAVDMYRFSSLKDDV